MKGYYAFWRYSSFPYLLGGRITEMREDGAVETEQFGTGSYYHPVKILPPKAGEEFLRELKKLERQHDTALRNMKAGWDKKSEELLKSQRISPK